MLLQQLHFNTRLELKYVFYLSLFLFLTTSLASQNKKIEVKIIQGKVTHLKAPLLDVHIKNKTKNTATKTNSNGNYSINAQNGDELVFSYVGFKTIIIVVEDITNILNIEMITKVNELDEAVVIADRSRGKEMERSVRSQKKFRTAVGVFNPMSSGFKTYYISGKELNVASPNLALALKNKFPGGGVPPTYDIDGQIFTEVPLFLDLSTIEDVYILSGANAGVRYGPIGRYGVVIVKTIMNPYSNTDESSKQKKEKYLNNNFYQNDARADYNAYKLSNSGKLKKISGKITFQNSPLADVNIFNLDSKLGTKTNVQGNYTIEGKIGDIIQFSYVGLKTISIVVEDVTDVINLEMVEEIIEIEEAVVKTNRKGIESKRSRKADKKFKTSMGWFNPKAAGYEVVNVEGQELNLMNVSIAKALVGKIAGYTIKNGQPYLRGANMSVTQDYPAIWDVDGAVYTSEPPVDISQIKDIRVLKSLSAVNRYGNIANGGVIIIRTEPATFENGNERKNKGSNAFTNKNMYQNDALINKKEELSNNPYSQILIDKKVKDVAFRYYRDSLLNNIKEFSTHLDIVQDFKLYYKDDNVVRQILKELQFRYKNNPEKLKAIVYYADKFRYKTLSLNLYKAIFKLRPNYAQSYRDLANAYVHSKNYNMAWKLYMSYLLKAESLADEGISEIIYSEMEWLYFKKKNQLNSNIQFVPKNESLEAFSNDLRVVFEWNTSEAEFDLEFVNPNQRAYNFEHDLNKNQALITDEKRKGYSSKEFIIDEIGDGEWLINLTYKGNKKSDPTYLKVTTYYFWAKPNEHAKIDVYKLDKTHKKIQLFRFNKHLLLVSK